MKTTRTYLIGCTWCKALGYVNNLQEGWHTGSVLTITCPVCNGSKTVIVTETIEDDNLSMESFKKINQTNEHGVIEANWETFKRFKEHNIDWYLQSLDEKEYLREKLIKLLGFYAEKFEMTFTDEFKNKIIDEYLNNK
jgi:uncharacterized Zn finger protein (UPF0148 family)